jgi:hypothetical protein
VRRPIPLFFDAGENQRNVKKQHLCGGERLNMSLQGGVSTLKTSKSWNNFWGPNCRNSLRGKSVKTRNRNMQGSALDWLHKRGESIDTPMRLQKEDINPFIDLLSKVRRAG